jgi:hypothetical protein
MTAIIFMDTETTGLALTDDIWEFAAIRREDDGTETEHHLFIEHSSDKCEALPESFQVDHRARFPRNGIGIVTREQAAGVIHNLTADRPHIVGAVPNFDTERLSILLRAYGHKPGWHYHLIDVENLAVGWLAASGIPIDLPWNSDVISAACGVEVPVDERHTAMGDASWARAIYDKIMGGAR